MSLTNEQIDKFEAAISDLEPATRLLASWVCAQAKSNAQEPVATTEIRCHICGKLTPIEVFYPSSTPTPERVREIAKHNDEVG